MPIKNLLLILVFLSSLIYLSSGVNGEICTGAQVCSNYNIDCKIVPDGFCPEKYGDWGTCDQQTYGKCTPCDIDCGTCGQIEIIAQEKANPASKINFIVIARPSITPDTIRILKGIDLSGAQTNFNSQCSVGENLCSREFIDYQVSSVGGDDEFITATTDNFKLQGIKAIKQIEINPEVVLSVLNVPDANLLNPGVSNNIQLNVNVKSLQGVVRTKIYAYKKDPKTNEFRPVKVNGVVDDDPRYCSFQCDPSLPTQKDCNLLKTVEVSTLPQDQNFVIDWGTQHCDNREFRLDAVGYDGRDNFNDDTLTFAVNNANPRCVDECILFNSRLLNTVYFKVKSWIS
ncbi:MAG: hypothetical protein AABW45_02760 [Nanoarchaeota archaeon]